MRSSRLTGFQNHFNLAGARGQDPKMGATIMKFRADGEATLGGHKTGSFFE
jgi:hypothetical protein